MPTRKKFFGRKRKFAKRKRAPRRASGPSRTNLYRTGAFADRHFCKLRYATTKTISNIPSLGSTVFSTNLYDPDYTGIGHQNMGFDQLAAIYNRYRVYGITYKLTFVNTSTQMQTEVAAIHKVTSGLESTMEDLLERPYRKSMILGIEGSGQAVKTITGYLDLSRLWGVAKKLVRIDDLYQAAVGDTGGPTRQGYLQLYTWPLDGTTATASYCRVQMIHHCVFFDRKNLISS